MLMPLRMALGTLLSASIMLAGGLVRKPLQHCLFTPGSQRQLRGKRRILKMDTSTPTLRTTTDAATLCTLPFVHARTALACGVHVWVR